MTADSLPLERAARAPRPPGLIKRLLRLLFARGRGLTRAEQRELDAAKLERARQKSREAALQLEAEQYARNISDKLQDLGVCYEYKKRDGEGLARFKLVRFMRPYVLRDEAIYLKADLRPGKSPRGVGVAELAEPRIVENLSIAVGHPVFTRYSPEKGFWYIVERELGKRGIPTHVKFDDMLANRPAHMDGLAVPLGVGADKRYLWPSFSKLLSMLIAGSPNGGKSNAVNAFICALIRFNRPNKVRLVLVDLKGGVEFSFYKGLPHLLEVPIDDKGGKAGIVRKREQLIPALEWLIGEGERRQERLEEEHLKKISEYNYAHRARPMSHIFLVIDEWADVKVEPKLGARAEELLVNISNRFRNVGVHVILSTQSPTKEVLSLRVKNAIQAKLVFNCSSPYASMVVIGNQDAYKLEPQGRAIFENLDTRAAVQTPFINNDLIEATVAAAIAGEFEQAEARAHDVSEQEIFDWAVSENRGHLPVEALFTRYRARGMTKEWAEQFARRVEGSTVMVGTSTYKVMAATGGGIPRRLISTDVLEQEAAPAPEPRGPVVAEQALIEWALSDNEGRLGGRAVFEAFREQGLTKRGAEALCKSVEGRVFTVAGVEYRVLPGFTPKAGQMAAPRRLQALNPPAPPSAPAQAEPTGTDARGDGGAAMPDGHSADTPEAQAPPAPPEALPPAHTGETITNLAPVRTQARA